ncbi:MAG: transcription-repair coupling factor [Acidiferrobacteraceae bacterium]|nr:transcription-repair coupling factor [Acidiferrobacteraceae bacterium]
MASPFSPPIPELGAPLAQWSGLHGSTLALALSNILNSTASFLILVAEDNRVLRLLRDEVQFYLSNDTVTPSIILPDWDCLPYDLFSPHLDITSERLRTLSTLPTIKHGFLGVTIETLMQRLPPPEHIVNQTFLLKKGEALDLDNFREQLQHSGYRSVSKVMEPGEYAIRGGVFDIFAIGFNHPFRLDLFGPIIESISRFDTDSQRSSEALNYIDILPAHEFPTDKQAISKFRKNFRTKFEGDPQNHQIYREVSKGNLPTGLQSFFPLFFDETATIFDYVSPDAIWVFDSDTNPQADSLWANIVDRFQIAQSNPERRPLPPSELYIKPNVITKKLSGYRNIVASREISAKGNNYFASVFPPEFLNKASSDHPYSQLVNYLLKSKGRTLITSNSRGRLQAIDELLTQNQIFARIYDDWHHWINDDQVRVGLTTSQLERGLVLPEDQVEIITESQLSRKALKRAKSDRKRSTDPESVIRSLSDLNIGDPVVHEEQGVGRYRGLQVLNIANDDSEFLVLEYQNSDRLYVPILSLELITRYIGGDPETAPLHKLGSDIWDKSKKRAQKKIRDVAVELLEANALREVGRGYKFETPKVEYKNFVENFPYKETPDQIKVIQDIIEDLSSDMFMDRLVCGDVGFGKTEIALRAAFIAVHNNKQVAILVPTTILAQQHFETFVDRFSSEPIQIELLSRFRSTSELEKVITSLPNGQPDIVIGTHRLLQSDIRFRELGLIIIDEEHRFGVRQKEKLKIFRGAVDTLSLTATPIPRTLNISLSGLRSISLITTPPLDRHAIKTFISQWSDHMIREACLREIHRGGQIFFLHNEVRSIDKVAKDLADLMPEVSIRIGHGQMHRYQLERVMDDFHHQRFSILVCTTIIESGIDFPNANTIIITKAHRYGLAQLYQLRGRVGRSHQQAYAYLIIPNDETLSDASKKRLDAIMGLEELGSGFMLASHDLEIRGAGELLGESQSGAIDEIGFSLYTEYLKRTIVDITDSPKHFQRKLEFNTETRTPPDLKLNVPALFPDFYLPDVHQRLIFYKRIAGAKDSDELYELRLEAIDRFGPLPDAARSLFSIRTIQLKCQDIGIKRFLLDKKGGSINFVSSPQIEPTNLLHIISKESGVFQMINSETLHIRKTLLESDARLNFAEQLINDLAII